MLSRSGATFTEPAARARAGLTSGEAAVAALAFLVAAVVRLPFRADFLVNWDAVNFALGVEGFDLAHHEPHPPGYLGYVLLARAVEYVSGDINAALTLISVAAAAATTALVYVLARRMADRTSSIAVTALFTFAPLTWYYGRVALSYAPGAAIAMAVVVACHRARFGGDRRSLLVAAFFLATLGALRQTDLLLLAPLVAFAAMPFPRRVQVAAAGLVAGLSALWLAPLLWLSGGVERYTELSRELAALTGGRTAVVALDPDGVLHNLRLVATGLLAGLFAALALVALVRRDMLTRDEFRFFGLWVGPPMAVFVFIHTGQLGYVLMVTPAVYAVLARALWLRQQQPPLSRSRVSLRSTPALVLPLLLIDIAAIGVLPSAIVARADEGRAFTMPVFGAVGLPRAEGVLPLDITANDAHWARVLDYIRATDPETTVVVTGLNGEVSFRQLGFYLREHTMYAVDVARDGGFGHLFTARDGTTDYSVDGLATESRFLELPPTATDVIVFRLRREVQTDLPHSFVVLDDGTHAIRLRVPAGATLEFDGDDDEVCVIGMTTQD